MGRVHLCDRAWVYATLLIIVINKGVVMKVRASIKSLKNQPGSQVVRRRGRVFVINNLNPRWKGRQG
jgi:large subunit ribosomal protein L36